MIEICFYPYFYSFIFPALTGPALIAVFLLKLMQQSCINMVKLLLVLFPFFTFYLCIVLIVLQQVLMESFE